MYKTRYSPLFNFRGEKELLEGMITSCRTNALTLRHAVAWGTLDGCFGSSRLSMELWTGSGTRLIYKSPTHERMQAHPLTAWCRTNHSLCSVESSNNRKKVVPFLHRHGLAKGRQARFPPRIPLWNRYSYVRATYGIP